jgi:uncharacterized delta-60 repeat protein
LAAGDLDSTFSGDGKTIFAYPGGQLLAADVAVQYDDQKIIVAGKKGLNAVVARLNTDGSVDTSFGENGLWTFPQAVLDEAYAVAIQQGDGKIVVAGMDRAGSDDIFTVARLLPNGTPDLSFGIGGIVHTDVDLDSEARDVFIQRDGKILAAGYSRTDSFPAYDRDMLVVRYLADGTPDPNFANDGIRLVGLGDEERADAITVDYTGNPLTNPRYGMIYAVGVHYHQNEAGIWEDQRFAVACLNSGGGFDNGFDGDGRLITHFPGSPDAYASGIVVQPGESGGEIVVTGTLGRTSAFPYNDIGMVRYLTNGVVDTAWGPNASGMVRTNITVHDSANDAVTSFSGGILVTGSTTTSSPGAGQFAVVAYTADGFLDNRFSGDGIATTEFAGLSLGGAGIATMNGRKFVVAGGAGIARYIDVGSVVSIGSFDPNASETGPDSATFIVGRTQILSTPERVFLFTGGAATPPNTFPSRPRDYNGTNITFGNGVFSSTYVDIPAGASFTVVTITPVDDTLIEGDETAIFTIGGNFAYDIGFPPSTTLMIRDNDTAGGPAVAGSQFVYQTAPQRVQFSFSQDVIGSIADSDFQLSGPAGVPPHTFSYDQLTNTATLSFNGIVPDGNYTARAIASGITNAAGQPMSADHLLSFFFLQGDANHDRTVNLQDFDILAANFVQSNRTFSQGDFNYDGLVNLADFNLLAGRFGQSVSPQVFGRDPITVAEPDRTKLIELLNV